VVALVVAAPERAPVVADDLFDRLLRSRENREPAQDGPQAVLLADVVRACAEALLAADGRESRVEQVAEKLPARRRLVTADTQVFRDAINRRARRHRAREARESVAVAGDGVARVLGDEGQRVAGRDEEFATEYEVAVAVAVAGRAEVGRVVAEQALDQLGGVDEIRVGVVTAEV